MMVYDSLVSRRRALGLFAAGLSAPQWLRAQRNEFEFSALDHIEFYVSNAEKSRDFYVRIFGNTLKMRGAKRYLKLGATYMAFEPPRGNGATIRVDHFSVAVKSLDMPRFHAFLEARGVAYQDYPSGRDTGINDPDGTRMQISPEDGWTLLNSPNFPPEEVPLAETPVFQPAALDYVLLNVTDMEKSAAFYQKLLGVPSARKDNSIWFDAGTSRIGLQQTPAGRRPGVHRFCVSAAPFNQDTVLARLRQTGAQVASPAVAGAVEFRDPDGYLIEVTDSRR